MHAGLCCFCVNLCLNLALFTFLMSSGYVGPSKAMEVHLTESANGREVELRVGQSLVLSLPENRTTGYSWQLVKNGAAVCRLVEDVNEQTAQRIGSPGSHRWRFVAEKPGVSTIEMHLIRPWKADEVTRSFSLKVRVPEQ